MISLLATLFGLALFAWSQRFAIDPQPPMPRLVRRSFVVFVVSLLLVGGLLVLGAPNIIPWRITTELAALAGWMFIGASAYFAYGVLRPSWLNAAGQLLGFLAYDLVLIVPFLTRLPTTPSELLPGLVVYTAVVI